MRFFDIVVSGAGISGLIAGIRAQQLGFKSNIIEKQKAFVETLKGEFIQPTGLRTLMRMGIAPEIEQLGLPVFSNDHHFWPLTPFRKPMALQCAYPEDENFPNHAVAIPHLELKNALVKIYQRLGGELSMDSMIERADEGLGNEMIVDVKKSGERKTLVTKHLVISEGTFSLLAKKMNFDWADGKDPISYMVGGLTTHDSVPMGRAITSQSKEGLFFAFKITPALTRVYFYKDNVTKDENPFKERRPESFLAKSLETSAVSKMFHGARLDKRVLAAPYVPKYAKNPSKGLITLTGDSAGSSHPLGAFGMSSAADDGMLIINLYKNYVDGKITLKEMNATYNNTRLKRYLTNKFVSDAITFIVGGTSKKSRAIRRIALRTWSQDPRARQFCGRLLGGMLEEPLNLTDFLSVWGFRRQIPAASFVKDVPKIYYGSRNLLPLHLLPAILKP